MAKVFTTPYATKSAQYGAMVPAIIDKIELKGPADTVSDYADFGLLDKGELTFKAKTTTTSGNRKPQTGFEVDGKGVIKCGGTAMYTALLLILSNGADMRITLRSGDKYSFTESQCSISFDEEAKGNGESNIEFPFVISGYVTSQQYIACHS